MCKSILINKTYCIKNNNLKLPHIKVLNACLQKKSYKIINQSPTNTRAKWTPTTIPTTEKSQSIYLRPEVPNTRLTCLSSYWWRSSAGLWVCAWGAQWAQSVWIWSWLDASPIFHSLSRSRDNWAEPQDDRVQETVQHDLKIGEKIETPVSIKYSYKQSKFLLTCTHEKLNCCFQPFLAVI